MATLWLVAAPLPTFEFPCCGYAPSSFAAVPTLTNATFNAEYTFLISAATGLTFLTTLFAKLPIEPYAFCEASEASLSCLVHAVDVPGVLASAWVRSWWIVGMLAIVVSRAEEQRGSAEKLSA
jgi:hypothetical protein